MILPTKKKSLQWSLFKLTHHHLDLNSTRATIFSSVSTSPKISTISWFQKSSNFNIGSFLEYHKNDLIMILMNFMNFLTVQKFKFIKFMHIHDCLSDVKYFRFAGNILSKLFFQRPLVAIPMVKITLEAEFVHSIRWESSLLYHMEVSSLVLFLWKLAYS